MTNTVPVAVIACTMTVQAEELKDVLQDSLSTIEALNARLGRTKNKASADSGAPEIAWISKKYAGITVRLLNMTSPADFREASRNIAALRMKAKEVTAKFQANMLRIQKKVLITPELAHAFIQMYPPSARQAATDGKKPTFMKAAKGMQKRGKLFSDFNYLSCPYQAAA